MLKSFTFTISQLLLFNFFTYSQNLTLEDIWKNYNTYASSPKINWLDDSTTYELRNNESIIMNHLTINGNKTEEISLKSLPDSLFPSEVIYKPHLKHCLLYCNTESLYRHSESHYLVWYNIETQHIDWQSNRKFFNPTFSDDDSLIAFTDKNNIYSLSLNSFKLDQLTFNGEWNKIINGRADWVNEEEFSFSKAYEWIGAGHQIIYFEYDEQEVPLNQIPKYQGIGNNSLYEYKYPKVDESPSSVSIKLIDLNTKKTAEIEKTNDKWTYYALLKKSTKDKVLYGRMDRKQQELEIIEIDNQGNMEIVYDEKSEKYVEIPSSIESIKNGFLIDSYKTSFKSILKIEKGTETQLTQGFDVSKFIFYDEKKDELWVTGHFYNTWTNTLMKCSSGKCMPQSDPIFWVEVQASPNGKNLVIEKSNLQTEPAVTIIEINTGKELLKIENKRVSEFLKDKKLGKSTLTEITHPNGHKISTMQILPTNFKPKKKYPVIQFCYGGQGYNEVKNQWDSFNYFYHQILAQKGYMVVIADGRGTMGRGWEYKSSTYAQLGKLESDDQIFVAQYMKKKKYVDAKRIGIWGWSFGGYLSSMCLGKAPDVYKSAISIAPVTDWRNYDNIYTERYNGLLKENKDSYVKNSPLHYAENIKGRLLLVHGSGDDNVLFQNSIKLSEKLIEKGIDFEQFVYINRNHGIYGGNTRFHLYQKMLRFWEKEL